MAGTYTEQKWQREQERAHEREETARQLGYLSFEAYLREATLRGMSIPQMGQETGLTNHHIREGLQDLLIERDSRERWRPADGEVTHTWEENPATVFSPASFRERNSLRVAKPHLRSDSFDEVDSPLPKKHG